LRLEKLSVRDWRNFALGSLELEGKVTVLCGQNGEGKSNLLEAVYMLVGFRSFRTSAMSELVRWGAASARIAGVLVVGGVERKLEVELSPGKRRSSMDGKSVRRDSAALTGASVVVFSPEDLQLASGPATERRRELDRAVFAVYRPYYREASDFERALRSRNSVLRRGESRGELLDSYDETLAELGARIVVRRRGVVKALERDFSQTFSEINGGSAAMSYRSEREVEEAKDEAEIRSALQARLLAGRERDMARGFTGSGPQRDDLEIKLGERLAREHGSQGQLRALVLALKLAELRYASQGNGEAPLLLLDDVASELDEERRGRLFGAIASTSCQTLITVTEREHLPELAGRVDFVVKAGQVRRVEE
jgi:DNA replication and repair protein RecF